MHDRRKQQKRNYLSVLDDQNKIPVGFYSSLLKNSCLKIWKKKSKITSISSALILCIIKANLAYSIALTRQNDIIVNKNKKNIRWRWSECYSSIFPSPSANNCFSIIAQVLSNSVLNSANNESTAHCYNCDDYLYQDEHRL